MLGVGKCVVGLAFGVSLMPLLNAYPAAVLGPMVALAGGVARPRGLPCSTTTDWLVILPAAIVMAWTQTLYGFLAAVVLYALLGCVWHRDGKPSR